MSKNVEEKILELRAKLNYWNKKYFEENISEVPDRVYDTQLRILIKLEQQNPQFFDPNSPSQIIGDFAKSKFTKFKHNQKMLSLNKAYSYAEIEKFVNDINVLTKETNYFYIEPKIDGISIILIYENKKLVKAITRGDGEVGEDVSDNIFAIITDIPTFVNTNKRIEIRGEIFLSIANFNILNKEQKLFANPRNAASGTLRQLDKEIVRSRNLSCYVYEIINNENLNIFSFKESIAFLKANNFRVQENNTYSNNLKELILWIDNFTSIATNLDYEIDGLVIKMDNLKNKNKIGYTSKFPKYNLAFKFDDQTIETKVIDIFVSVGRTGRITYNAKLEPVLLRGSIVSAATLHNYNYVQELSLNINDIVKIKKAGEIIPKVIKVSEKKSNGVFQIINNCPFCNFILVWNKEQIEQYCPNKNCNEQKIRALIHFVSRDALDIKHLGEKWIRIFYEKKFLEYPYQIFNLKNYEQKILELERISNKSYANLINSIEKVRTQSDLASLIFALGIPSLGKRNSKIIADTIQIFENILNYDFSLLLNTHDIGPITIKEIQNFLNSEINRVNIENLISLGINPSTKITNIANSNYKDKKIAISGSFDNFSRNMLIKLIESKGGFYSSSISSKTNFLLCGENAGSKKEKAEKLNITILTIEEFENN